MSHSGLTLFQTSCMVEQEAKAHSWPSPQALCLRQNCSMVISCVILWILIYGSFSDRQMVFTALFTALAIRGGRIQPRLKA
jgi:hypothetical protein